MWALLPSFASACLSECIKPQVPFEKLRDVHKQKALVKSEAQRKCDLRKAQTNEKWQQKSEERRKRGSRKQTKKEQPNCNE